MKHLIIINPHSGSIEELGGKEGILKSFEGLDYEVHETAGPRTVIGFLKQYFKDHKELTRVYACGGDGTLHEVVNGIVGVPNAELALIALGTGNDFAKIYGGKDAFHDPKRLIEGTPIDVDLSLIRNNDSKEEMYSINVINFGFDAIVGARGNYYKDHGYPEKAIKKGMSPYDYALKHDAMKHGRFNEIVVYADGEQLNQKKMLLATIAQGQYVGGKFRCAPKSDNTDGMMDVCVLKTMSLIGLGMLIGKYTRGEHLNKNKKKIVYRRVKEVTFVAPQYIDVCVDGEMIVGKDFTVECKHKAIKFVIPAK